MGRKSKQVNHSYLNSPFPVWSTMLERFVGQFVTRLLSMTLGSLIRILHFGVQ
jgi:hypothetical protein